MLYDVFISYSTKDKNFAFDLIKKVEENDIRCFIAPRNITPGKEYSEEIVNAIKSCNIVIIIFTSNSNSSSYVLREINSAVLHNKTIIPLKIEDIDISPSMEFYLSVNHWLEVEKELQDRDINFIINSIKPFIKINKIVIEEEKEMDSKPIVCNYNQLRKIGYDMKTIVMRTIEIDYLCVDSEEYIINEDIEGSVYDWVKDCNNYPELFSALVFDKEIVGYWRLSVINEENFNLIIDGSAIINPTMSEFYEFGGKFFGYIGLLPIISDFSSSVNYLMLIEDFFERLADFYERDIVFDKIGISIYSKISENIVQKLGFKKVGINLAKGAIYVLNLNELTDNSLIKNKYKRLYNYYNKESI